MKQLLLLASLAVPMMATVIVSDPTMAAGSYSGATAAFPFGGSGTTSNTSFAIGGFPGAYRSTTFNFAAGNASGASAVGELNVTNVWDFATQGTLNTLAFRIDDQLIASPAGFSQMELLFGVRQNGITYYNAVFTGMSGAWSTVSRSGLTQASFGSAFVTGAPQPNFSATSGILEVGYFVSTVAVPGSGSAVWNTDNFCAIGNGALTECSNASTGTPEPGTIALLGSALIVLGGLRYRRS